MTSNTKTNLKFIINSKVSKPTTKNTSTGNSDFSSTININTNSRIKEKYITKKLAEKTKTNLNINLNEKINNEVNSNNNSNYMISSNLIRKIEKIENPNPINKIKTISKENVKESNYNSNNSNSQRTSGIVILRPKHQKNLSEIPIFKNQITEGITHVSSSNLFEIYNQTTSAFKEEKERNRENEEKSNLDPKNIKIKSNFNRGGSVNSANRRKDASVTSGNRKMNTTGDEAENLTEESNCNTNTSNNIPIPKSNAKYQNLLIKYREQEKYNKDLLKTIDILKNYIKSTQNVTDTIKYEIADKINRKSLEIKKIKVNFINFIF